MLACLVIVLALGGLFASAYPHQDALRAPVTRVVALASPKATPIPPKPSKAPQTPKPTPKPLAKVYEPKPQPKVPAGSVQARLIKAWPGNDAAMLCIVRKETGGTFDPFIKSRTGKYWGLFQADANFRAAYGWAGWGVEEQAAMAWRGFSARGWQPWPTHHGCV